MFLAYVAPTPIGKSIVPISMEAQGRTNDARRYYLLGIRAVLNAELLLPNM